MSIKTTVNGGRTWHTQKRFSDNQGHSDLINLAQHLLADGWTEPQIHETAFALLYEQAQQGTLESLAFSPATITGEMVQLLRDMRAAQEQVIAMHELINEMLASGVFVGDGNTWADRAKQIVNNVGSTVEGASLYASQIFGDEDEDDGFLDE